MREQEVGAASVPQRVEASLTVEDVPDWLRVQNQAQHNFPLLHV